MKLSIIIPVYNEAGTIGAVIDRVLAADLGCGERELIVVNDGSSDGTSDRLAGLNHPGVRVVAILSNRGKGAAIAEGLRQFTGDAVVIQDADMEYDPADLKSVLGPIQAGVADVVYGSRFSGGKSDRESMMHYLGNRALTSLSNAFTGLSLTDMETCYKMFTADVGRRLVIEERRFGMEPEITARVAAMGVRVVEVPIGYAPRGYEEGKKIGLRDAFRAVYVMGKYGIRLRKEAQ